MVFAKLDPAINQQQLQATLKEQDILLSTGNPVRFVTHLGISRKDIETFLTALKQALKL